MKTSCCSVAAKLAGAHLERVVAVGRNDAVQAAPAVLALAVHDAARLQQALVLQTQQQQQQRGVTSTAVSSVVQATGRRHASTSAPPPGAGAAVRCLPARAGRSKAPCGSCFSIQRCRPSAHHAAPAAQAASVHTRGSQSREAEAQTHIAVLLHRQVRHQRLGGCVGCQLAAAGTRLRR